MIVRLTTIETSKRDGQRQAQRLEELADHAAHERQGQEDQDRRERRADDRAADLLAGPVHGRVARLSLGQVPRDVLDHDHGVVDDQADGHGQPAQRHQVQRVAGQVEEDEADDQAQGDGQRGDQRGPEALEEQQQDDHAEQAADDDGVADVGDGGADEEPLVVDRADRDAGRGRLRGVGQHRLQTRARRPGRCRRGGGRRSAPRRCGRRTGSPSCGPRARSSPGPGRVAGSTGRSCGR